MNVKKMNACCIVSWFTNIFQEVCSRYPVRCETMPSCPNYDPEQRPSIGQWTPTKLSWLTGLYKKLLFESIK